MNAQERLKKLEESTKAMKKEIKALKKELQTDEKEDYEFPFFAEFPNGEVVFMESGKRYSMVRRSGQGWSMSGGIHEFGHRSDIWSIEETEPFTGALIVVDGKVTHVEKH